MHDLRIDVTVRPPTISAAVYGAMAVVAEHTASMARLDDLRAALDELFHALPREQPVRVRLCVDVEADCCTVLFEADVRDVVVQPSVAALVEDLRVEHREDATCASLVILHD